MKNTGIMFKAEMVRAILAGRKTQTRRILPVEWLSEKSIDERYFLEPGTKDYELTMSKCRYGGAGDLLWVKETWVKIDDAFFYKADEQNLGPVKWKSPRFMPKEVCRLMLEIQNIRVERIQDISGEDAKAEGIEFMFNPERSWQDVYKSGFRNLWDEIYDQPEGFDSWISNPYVWVIEFKHVAPIS